MLIRAYLIRERAYANQSSHQAVGKQFINQFKNGCNALKTAILCPQYTVDSHVLKMLAEETKGTILKVIGGKTQRDYEEYGLVFIVYQYPLDPLNKEFIEFCRANKKLTKRSVLVINTPAPYIEELGTEQFSELVDDLKRMLISEDLFDLERNTTVIFNTMVDKNLQNECAKKLNVDLAPSLSPSLLKESRFLVIFSQVSEMFEKMTPFKANAWIILGIMGVPVGILTFYYATMVYDSAPGVPVSFGMALGGPVISYIGFRSKRYAKWMKTNTGKI